MSIILIALRLLPRSQLRMPDKPKPPALLVNSYAVPGEDAIRSAQAVRSGMSRGKFATDGHAGFRPRLGLGDRLLDCVVI